MGRIRTIKPEFWRHEDLSELPEATHMLAAALLNYADDEGYFNANPGLIKSECCPLREPSVSIQESLAQLANIGFIRLGTDGAGKRYGAVCHFLDHQRINRPTASKIKHLHILWEGAVNTHTQLSESSPPELGTGNGEVEGKGNRKDAVSDETGGEPPRIAEVPAPDPETMEAQVYRLGKKVLGANSGGMITKLYKHFDRDWLEVREALQIAATKGDPREYVAGILKPPEDPMDRVFAGAL